MKTFLLLTFAIAIAGATVYELRRQRDDALISKSAAVGYSCGYIHAGDDLAKRERTNDYGCLKIRDAAIKLGAFPENNK